MVAGLLFAVAMLAGLDLEDCYTRTVSGSVVTYEWAWWVSAVVFATCAVLTAAAVVMFRITRKPKALALVIVGPALAIGMGTEFVTDKVTVDDNHFAGRYGVWLKPTRFDVRFDDVSAMAFRSEQVEVGRGEKAAAIRLDCRMNDGRVLTIAYRDMVVAAIPDIVARAKAKGIPVTGRHEP